MFKAINLVVKKSFFKKQTFSYLVRWKRGQSGEKNGLLMAQGFIFTSVFLITIIDHRNLHFQHVAYRNFSSLLFFKAPYHEILSCAESGIVGNYLKLFKLSTTSRIKV
jgi:hypothetical protein